MSAGTLMVIGARKKSLGLAVAKMWSDMYDAPAVTVGVSGEEGVKVDGLEDAATLVDLFTRYKPRHVVCTVGINEELGDQSLDDWILPHLFVNAYLPIHILMTWAQMIGNGAPVSTSHYVAISSNSAHIPRSRSAAYGMSKAALSMGIRCTARDLARAEMGPITYGYEPGLIKGTAMSGTRGGTRMEGPGLAEGISRRTLAGQIVHNLAFGGPEQNGVLYRVDAGEV